MFCCPSWPQTLELSKVPTNILSAWTTGTHHCANPKRVTEIPIPTHKYVQLDLLSKMNENECLYKVVLKQKEDTSSDALVIF